MGTESRTNRAGNRLNRLDFLKLSGAGLAGATLLGAAGCGGGGAEKADDGSIVISFTMGPEETGTLDRLVRRFNEDRQGEYQVNYRVMPGDATAYFDLLKAELQSGNSNVDLIGGDVIWPAQFAANGWIADLSSRFTGKMRAEFLQGPIASNVYEGAVYGVPWYTDAGMLYYRKDLIEQSGFSGPPETWDNLIEVAKQVQRDSGVKRGFVFQGSDEEAGVVNGLEYINSYGGQVLDPTDASKVILDSPESIQGLAMERRLVEEGVSPRAVTAYSEEEAEASFLNGDAIFCRNWPYMYALAGNDKTSMIS